jgi:anaerobic magnesium-protoporphyrin IX monomethyl ester cyclase
MKILLAYMSGMPDRHDPYISLLPTGLCSLQACLKAAGYDALLVNFSGWSRDDIRRKLAELKPDLFGISQWTHNRHAAIDLAQLVRSDHCTCVIVMGGAHATCCYADILRQGSPVDCVVLGEGEETILELAGLVGQGRPWTAINGIACLINGQINVTPPRTPLNDLDLLPSAVAFLEHSIGVDIPLQAEFILTARGCPSACYFCSSPNIWKRQVRFRSPASVVDEMMSIRDRYGLIYFSLRDDTFTADRARTIEICRLLAERRAGLLWSCQSRVTALDEELLVWMKRAGCECIQLGVESGSPRILSRLGKTITPGQIELAAGLIRKVGINLSIYLITDVPGETDEDIHQTIELIRRIRPEDGYVSPLAHFPGTRMFEEAVAAGRIDRNVFMTSHHPAVYAAGKPGRNSRLLINALGSAAPRDTSRFRRQKELLGYCYVTNVLAGEHHRQCGDHGAAEREFREIVEREPDNPWGWYLLGELYGERGAWKKSLECYRMVCSLVPGHGPSLKALLTKKRDPEGPV